jgi:hypothetical protein
LDIVYPFRVVKQTGVANAASLRHVTVITSVPKRHPALFENIPADSFRRINLTEQPSQRPSPTENATAAGRTVEEWKQRVERPDNHWLDCLVGCAVAASMLGVKLDSEGPVKPVRKRYSLQELASQANRPTAMDLLAWTRREK